jgi:7-cyano-7-deazaguanine synthase
MQNKTAIVLLSGGQDSTTCLFWARREFEHVIALGFDYGQKHKAELDQAAKIAELAGVNFKVLNVEGLLSGSSLTDHSKDHNEGHNRNADLPASFTAGRNMLFLTIAASFGFGQKIEDLVTGVCQTDFSGYPDCRRIFIDSMQASLGLAMDAPFRIHTPLMYLTKAETWKLAAELNIVDIIRTQTLTDYNGDMTPNDWGMGKLDNPASELRAKGYYEAKANGWI